MANPFNFFIDPYSKHHEISWCTAGALLWTVPAGVTSILIECRGAGGGGLSAAMTGPPNNTDRYFQGAGGGGGEYALKLVTVVPGEELAIYIGEGGGPCQWNVTTPNNGGISKVDRTSTYPDTTLCSADGGRGAARSINPSPYGTQVAGTGGGTTSYVSETNFSYAGGDGYYCSLIGTNYPAGSGGGAASRSGEGGDAPGCSYRDWFVHGEGSGDAGDGGAGGSLGGGRQEGYDGSSPGGGGGGGQSTYSKNAIAGSGADGCVKIHYYL